MSTQLVTVSVRNTEPSSKKEISSSRTILISRQQDVIWYTCISLEIPLPRYLSKLLSMNSIVSIDYGTRKSGLAYSVEGFCFAWKTVSTSELLAILPAWIQMRKAQLIVIGMPYNIDGSMSKHGKRVSEFMKKLETIVDIPIICHDERLTTSEALLGFDEYGVNGDIDAEAARLILVDYLSGR